MLSDIKKRPGRVPRIFMFYKEAHRDSQIFNEATALTAVDLNLHGASWFLFLQVEVVLLHSGPIEYLATASLQGYI